MFKYILNIIDKIKNYKTNKYINRISNMVVSINNLNKKFSKLNNNDISNYTKYLKNKINNENISIDNLLIESYALVKEVCKRTLKINLFDTQIMGSITLHESNIAEMLTGEGKTLCAILPAYLNSLKNNVHIVTVNDYLAKRDYENNKCIFDMLGVSSSFNISNMSINDKKKAYKSDIVYGTSNEYCFDYLKDNMVINNSDKVQNKLDYVIIDEIDSILIDESKTPLIISEYEYNISYIYKKFIKLSKIFIKNNDKKYIKIDLKLKQIYLTELGFELLENLMIKNNFIYSNDNLYSSKNVILIQYIINAIKSYIFFKKNVDYIIKDNKIIIIDENTGRMSEGKRWSDGLHQFIEAKENLNINNENVTLSYITFQNYFKLYKKISGMTGTAYTEKKEFYEIYNLNVIPIPTYKPIIRKNYDDLMFFNDYEKFEYISNDVLRRINNNQPVLIGTTSIEKSELISDYLKKKKIKHKILNAKNHKLEAKIISEAGRPKSVTISTNMAGRGTDIVLGGKNLKNNKIDNLNNKIVIDSGGLHVIGIERHESRRIDNQLIGRSGRQGDPGSSQFYLSINDNIIKTFMSDKSINFIKSINIKNEPIKSNIINNIVRSYQLKIEEKNFNIRKQLIIYDNVFNDQRNIIYTIRNNILDNYKINIIYFSLCKNIFFKIINLKINTKNIKIIKKKIIYNINKYFFINIKKKIDIFIYIKNKKVFLKKIEMYNFIINKIYKYRKIFNNYKINYVKKIILIKILDVFCKDNIINNEILKKTIFLRSYGNKNPKQEYKIESFFIFKKMIYNWEINSIKIINNVLLLSNNKKFLNYNNNSFFNFNEINNFILFLIKN